LGLFVVAVIAIVAIDDSGDDGSKDAYYPQYEQNSSKDQNDSAAGVITLLFVVGSIVLQVKRFHDLNRSGWWSLLSFVPIAGLWVLIQVGFVRGTIGPNRYGPDPLETPTSPHYATSYQQQPTTSPRLYEEPAYCPKCGRKTVTTDTFCPDCGTQLRQTAFARQ
jgi:uncharacterized membrane protein YhaH (DUF805 family)